MPPLIELANSPTRKSAATYVAHSRRPGKLPKEESVSIDKDLRGGTVNI